MKARMTAVAAGAVYLSPMLLLSCSEPEAERPTRCVERCLQQRPGGCELEIGDCDAICEGGYSTVSAVPLRSEAPEENTTGAAPATVLANTLAIETRGGVATPLIPRCTLLPHEVVETFSTAEDNQSRVEIHLVAGEAPRPSEDRTIGRFHLEGIRPAPGGVPVIEVTMSVDRAGLLTIAARDRDTGARQEIRVTPSAAPSPNRDDARRHPPERLRP